MTDIFLPVSLDVARVRFRYLDTTGVSRNQLTGAFRSAARGGDKLGASLEFTPAGGASSTGKQKQRILKSLIARLSRANRVYLYDPGYVQQGSFPSTELLTNNDFSNGTTGWSSTGTFTVTDRLARLAASTPATGNPALYQNVTNLTQYAPHALRSFVLDGAQSVGTSFGTYIQDSGSLFGLATNLGLRTVSLVPISTTGQEAAVYSTVASGYTAGASVDVAYTSLSRCMLADNGPNALTYSDDFTNAAWTKSACTIGSSGTAPDGTATSNYIIENSATAAHYVFHSTYTVSSAVGDFCFCIALRGSGRNFGYIDLVEATGSTVARQFFNLNTGAVGASSSVGANWSNLRAFIKSMGGGWYVCCIVARKTNAATGVYVQVGAGSADGTSSYLGDGASGIYLWRATSAASSVPVKLTQTTSSATTGTAQSGSRIYVKGGPASASGSLLQGDWVQVETSLGSQRTMVVAPLDFDAAELGLLQVSPPVRGTLSDNAAIIPNNPMGRFVIASDAEWLNEPGIFTTSSADFEEAPA